MSGIDEGRSCTLELQNIDDWEPKHVTVITVLWEIPAGNGGEIGLFVVARLVGSARGEPRVDCMCVL